MLRPAPVAVADTDLHVLIAEAPQRFGSLAPEGFDDLDRVDLFRETGEHRGLVARACTYLEDDVVFFDRRELGHQRDDARLRDRLFVTDRQR